jgi:hypothetical protein
MPRSDVAPDVTGTIGAWRNGMSARFLAGPDGTTLWASVNHGHSFSPAEVIGRAGRRDVALVLEVHGEGGFQARRRGHRHHGGGRRHARRE